MERTDYEKQVKEIKTQILDEVRKLVPEDSAHKFSDKFYCHYIEGEVATTETMSAVEVWHGGMVVFVTHSQNFPEDNVMEGDSVYQYDMGTFLDILEHLKKDVREKKLAYLRKLVEDNNGNIEFNGTFEFTGDDGDDGANGCSLCEGSKLIALTLSNGKLFIRNEWEGDDFDNTERYLPDFELDRIIEYVEGCMSKTFKIKAIEAFSRVFEIQAVNYEAAVEKARQILLDEPFTKEDSDGLTFS